MSKRKIITDTLDNVSPYELEGTLVDLRGKVNDWIDEYGPTARLDWDPYFQYDYDPTPTPRFDIKHNREEDDDEFATRVAKEKADKAAREARERVEYERLQKKFESKKGKE